MNARWDETPEQKESYNAIVRREDQTPGWRPVPDEELNQDQVRAEQTDTHRPIRAGQTPTLVGRMLPGGVMEVVPCE